MPRSRVYLQVDRVDAAICAAARSVSVSDLHEAMGPGEGRAATMSSHMRPLVAGLSFAGPALTASCSPGDNLMMHRALYLAREGDVLVVSAPDGGAQWGDIAAYYAKKKGLAGIVIDGCIRDTDELARMRSPVWCTRIAPSSPQKSGYGTVNAPLVCGGVRVAPGDLVVGDGDGVIAVPRALAAAAIERARTRMLREQAQRAEIDAGKHPWHLHGAADNYAGIDVEEIDAPWKPDA